MSDAPGKGPPCSKQQRMEGDGSPMDVDPQTPSITTDVHADEIGLKTSPTLKRKAFPAVATPSSLLPSHAPHTWQAYLICGAQIEADRP